MTSVKDTGIEVRRQVGSWAFGFDAVEDTSLYEIHGLVAVLNNPRKRWCSKIYAGTMVETLDYLLGYNPGNVHKVWGFYGRWLGLTNNKYPYSYGERIGECIDDVLQNLSHDITSRHTYIPIYRPSDILKNFQPCNVGIMFLSNEKGALDTIVFNRSQDVWRGYWLDTFAYSLLGEVVATELGVNLGSYIILYANAHIYKRDLNEIKPVSQMFGEVPLEKKFSEEKMKIAETFEVVVNSPFDTDRIVDMTEGLSTFWHDYLIAIATRKNKELISEIKSPVIKEVVMGWK
jgi:thymidylate synthase